LVNQRGIARIRWNKRRQTAGIQTVEIQPVEGSRWFLTLSLHESSAAASCKLMHKGS
jgi:hypothetical protein